MVKQNADNAKQANQLAAGARETADKGGSVVDSAVVAMSGRILPQTIEQIAEKDTLIGLPILGLFLADVAIGIMPLALSEPAALVLAGVGFISTASGFHPRRRAVSRVRRAGLGQVPVPVLPL